MTAADRDDRRLDVVVHGATGFVGRLTAERLAAQAPAGLRVGISGRSRERLEALRSALGPDAAGWEVMVADAQDAEALDAVAASTRVVVSTVGPYVRHGLPLVEACARNGTDYADLAGEVVFVRRSIDACHELARSTGARVVHACGFDSVPSDLAVLLLHERVVADDAGQLEDTTLVVRVAKGGVSGGTIDSMRNQLDAVRDDPALRSVTRDPYGLSPARDAEPTLVGPRTDPRPRRDAELGTWTAPFVMSPFNTRIVRRSNALLDHAYGRRFRYREVVGTGSGPAAPVLAVGITALTAALAGGLALRPTRALLDRVLPRPGTGPSERTRREGRFVVEVHTRTSTGARYVATVAAVGDPGYAATAVMLVESALALALDRSSSPDRAGVLTPATALGTVLVDRLRAAGQQLTVSPR